MFKNALVSVSDKTGLVEFLKPLADKGLRIVSTGGSAEHLKKAGIKITEIREQTGFPEVMGGRVKTLHPRIHMPLLARDFEAFDLELLKNEGLEPFDLVVVNLYPFEETLLKQETDALSEQDLIEKIDIGGPTLLRASAKNFSRITVIADPSDYQWISAQGQTSLEDRKKLAGKVFALVSRYDSLISHWFGAFNGPDLSFGGSKVQELRYGENPNQQASWYANSGDRKGLHTAKILQGKPLSYNNILDLEAATQLAKEFDEPTAVAVKHNNPCGVGLAPTILEAAKRASSADPVSVFGGIVALNREVDGPTAELLDKIFLECVVAPKISSAAMEVFAKKKNLRVLEWPNMMTCIRVHEVRTLAGGFLVQGVQSLGSETSKWKFLGEVPAEAVMQDLIFAEKVCASLKSNAIAIVKNGQTLGLGMGQVNRVEAVAHAVTRMQAHHQSKARMILASDAFFPFPDSIEKASEAGVKWILQPGGSLRDQEVFATARRLGVNMVLTGERHFRH
ncbi:MAG: bifunctional phosphoribosylaminoimidazolecarboxamide formyltransferase/IMP cyclohydrolase [Bdellovibrio sp.]|jgi:phosphoribosylaminoimidazolecarboxamide formyltransferase/IMP cyclohydrolase